MRGDAASLLLQHLDTQKRAARWADVVCLRKLSLFMSCICCAHGTSSRISGMESASGGPATVHIMTQMTSKQRQSAAVAEDRLSLRALALPIVADGQREHRTPPWPRPRARKRLRGRGQRAAGMGVGGDGGSPPCKQS